MEISVICDSLPVEGTKEVVENLDDVKVLDESVDTGAFEDSKGIFTLDDGKDFVVRECIEDCGVDDASGGVDVLVDVVLEYADKSFDHVELDES